MDRGNTSWRSVLVSLGLFILIISGCIGGLFFTMNTLCRNSLTQKLPIYEGAEVVWEWHNALTTFGVGQTYMVLESSDDQATVHDWYNRYTANLLRNRRDEKRLRFGRSQWNVIEQEDGTGSEITLRSVCAQ